MTTDEKTEALKAIVNAFLMLGMFAMFIFVGFREGERYARDHTRAIICKDYCTGPWFGQCTMLYQTPSNTNYEACPVEVTKAKQ